jgi:ribosomal-protein-alanine N-acetyltransferase
VVKIFSDRLIIRDLSINDLENHHELLSDSTVMKYLQDIKTNDINESKENLLAAINDIESNDRKFYFFVIEDKVSKEFIGEIGYTVMQNTPFRKLVHMGYFIKQKYWDNGYTTEASKKVIEYAFNENNVYRIHIGCIKENTRSEKVMKKCGFIKEAEFKEYALHDGKLKDRIEYRLLKNEWKLLCEGVIKSKF